jgi:tetratricopeptide (TPR) repeat protein
MDIRNSTVGILAKGSGPKFAGTGFFVAGGLILTCAHVLDGASVLQDKIPFYLDGNDKRYYADVIFKSEAAELDIAILKPVDASLAAPGLSLVTSRESDGHDFKSFGYPLEGSGQGLRGNGTILGWVRDPLERDALQIESDEVTHGFSGCPVIDEQAGGVVGMVRTGFDFGLDKKFGREAFAMPSEALNKVWPALPLNPAVKPAARTVSLNQLPVAPGNFVGRVAELGKIIKQEGAAISGLGGVGKTALGLLAAHKLAEKYPDAQFFINMRGTAPEALAPQEAMRQVILSFDSTTDLRNYSDDQLCSLYNTLLTGKRALLFFDNARDAAQVRPLLPPPGNALLLTSQMYFHLEGVGESLRLDVLPDADALRLLTVICPRLAQAQNVSEIAALCGYLPLALKIAGTFLAEHDNWMPDKYLLRLKDKQLKTLKNEDDPTQDVEAIFELSYALLKEAEQKMWRALSVFSAPFSLAALGAVCELDEDPALDFAGKVERMSLLEYDPQTDRYHLHGLLRDFGAARLSKDEDIQAHLRHGEFFMRVVGESQNLYIEGGQNVVKGLKQFDSERVNIEAAQSWAAQNIESGAAELSMLLPGAGTEIFDLRITARQRIGWLESALSAARFLKNKEFEGSTLGSLGIAYSELGETRKAIEYHEQALAIARKFGERRGEGVHIGNLGTAYADLGETRKAIEYFEQDLLIKREIGDRHGEGVDFGNLGAAYANLGETQRAIDYYEQALVIDRETGDRRGEGATLGGLGNAYANLGETQKAIDYYEQDLTIAREIGDRRGEGATLGGLGNAYANLGETQKAIDYYEQDLTIAREIGDRRGEGAVLGNLGIAYAKLGETQKAIEYYEQDLSIAREVGDRYGEGAVLGGLGNAHANLGETPRAIEYYEQALTIAHEIGNRRGEGGTLGNLGIAYAKLGETQKAIECYEQALTIARAIGDRRGEGADCGNLGIAYAHLGETQKAIEYYEQDLAIKRELGDRHGEANALYNIGLAHQKLGETVRAKEIGKQALEIYLAIQDPWAEQTKKWLAGLG